MGTCALLRFVLRRVGLLSLGLLLAAAVPAPSHVEEISLDYSTAGDCPSMREFEEQVYARTQRVRFVNGHRSKRYFRVHLGTDSGVAVGRVTSGHGSEVGNAREVTSDSCSDVAAAIALVVALAVDPHASVGAIPESATSPAQPAAPAVDAQPAALPVEVQSAAPAVDAQRAAPVMNAQPAASTAYTTPAAPTASAQTGPGTPWPAPATPVIARPSEGPSAPIGDVTSAHPESSRPIALSVGARLNGALWWVPAAVPWEAVAVSFEGETTKDSQLASSFRLSGGYARSGSVSTSTGAQAHFAIASVQGDFCPIRIELSSSMHLRPCAGLTGGRLTGTGVGAGTITQSWSKNRPWATLDESLRLQIPLGKGWLSSIEAGLSEPLVGDTFVFERSGLGNITIATMPRLVPLLGVGVSRRFF